MPSCEDTEVNWKSRIVGHEKIAADQLLANPFNHRKHPQSQRDVINASINELGFCKSTIADNQRPNAVMEYIGHSMEIEQAKQLVS